MKFPKILKKRAFGTHNAPNPHKWDFWKKMEIFDFFKNLICGFGCVLGAKSPFFQNFRKVWKFLNSFHTLTVFIRQVLPAIIGPQIWSKWVTKGGICCIIHVPPFGDTSSSPNISMSTYRMKTTKVWKVFKNFGAFQKFSKKGLLAPRRHPVPQMKIFKKWEILG